MTSKGDAENWRDGAACRDADPEIFFPEGTAGPVLLEIDRARALCAECPVRARCLDWALRHGAVFGIWGGLTEDERRAVRRRALPLRPAQQAGTANG
jgi:WhiB family transcriptional regulator, redox-sensing transcriptional regulator